MTARRLMILAAALAAGCASDPLARSEYIRVKPDALRESCALWMPALRQHVDCVWPVPALRRGAPDPAAEKELREL